MNDANKTYIAPPLIAVGLAILYYQMDPTVTNPIYPYLFLSYPVPDTSDPVMYGKGVDDIKFVITCVIFISFFRSFCMKFILEPIAVRYHLKPSKVQRFMEQGYQCIYFSISTPMGLYIMYHTPIWYFNTHAFWENYPHKTHFWLFKFYYLMEISNWLQQSLSLILQIEKPRKDFYEFAFHHIITVSLVVLSYRFHFTWIGLAVYITMDITDIFLPLSKCLVYLDAPGQAYSFAVFAVVWIYHRHYLSLKILWSVLTEFTTIGPYSTRFEPIDWVGQQYKCYVSYPITAFLLIALQLVNIYWLYLIARIAVRIIYTGEKKDDRSDDEDDDNSESIRKKK